MKREILIVDDEPLVREPIAEILRQSGFHVEEASQGTEALKKLGKKDFDLMITDVLMPGMNGIELIRELHKVSPATEAIVFSAYGTEATRDKLERMGAFGYLDKPVRRDILLEMVTAAIKSNRMVRLGYEDKKPQVSFNRERVLVVDDDNTIRDLVSTILSEKGYRVNTVNDGLQAMEMILVNEYDCIILDINMPKMNGIETLEAIREQDSYTYILIISGEAEKGEVQQVIDGGADKFLAKPFKNKDLLHIIDGIDFEKINALKNGQVLEEKNSMLQRFSLFGRIFNPHRMRIIRQKLVQFAILIIIGLVAGVVAIYFDAQLYKASGEGILINRLDKLIHAVEQDWGR